MDLEAALRTGTLKDVRNALTDDNVNIRDKNDDTPLLWATREGHYDIAKTLLQNHAINPNLKDRSGRTPLIWAANNGNWVFVEKLLEKEGTDPNLRDHNGRALISWVAEKGNLNVVKLLLGKYSIAPDSQDDLGRTPLSWAAQEGNSQVVEFLLGREDIDVNRKDNNGRPPLSWAAKSGELKVVELLLGKDGIEPDSRDNNGHTALSLAAQNNYLQIVRALSWRDSITLLMLVQQGNQGLVQKLIECGCNTNVRDSSGKSTLHVAISAEAIDIATAIINCHATDINIEDSEGITPLRSAIRKKCCGLIDLLLSKSALTTGIYAKEWRAAFGKSSSDIVRLSEKDSGEKSVGFLGQRELQGDREQIFPTTGTDQQISFISSDEGWKSIPLPNLEPSPYELGILLPRSDGGQIDVISIAARFPIDEDLERGISPAALECDYWKTCRISWAMVRPPIPIRNRRWVSSSYYSMMPPGWMPKDGVEFFNQFMLHLQYRWLRLCNLAKNHLTSRRLDQLYHEGKNPRLIRSLANDAQKWEHFRSKLWSQILEANSFAVQYSQRYNGDDKSLRDMQQEINRVEATVNAGIDELDQTVRDLLQIELTWAAMTETRVATRLGYNVMLLTYVSIFFFPLAFCAAIWTIPNIDDDATRTPFAITSSIVGLVTILVAFNLENIVALYFCLRGCLLWAMKKSNAWKNRAEQLQESHVHRGVLSDWWLILFLLYLPWWSVTRLFFFILKLGNRISEAYRKSGDEESAS